MNFKLFAVILLLISATNTNASYKFSYPLESNKGGALPLNSIIFSNSTDIPEEPSPDNWVSYSPLIVNTVNTGSPYGCVSWSPSVENIQGFNDNELVQNKYCLQRQIQTIQNREINTNTNELRDVGDAFQSNSVLKVDESRTIPFVCYDTNTTYVSSYTDYDNYTNSVNYIINGVNHGSNVDNNSYFDYNNIRYYLLLDTFVGSGDIDNPYIYPVCSLQLN